jgi:glucose/arabinose dehydrogenase
MFALLFAGAAGYGGVWTMAQSKGAMLPACDPDNGAIRLPDGFCATVVADKLGAARHMTVAANGDIFVAIRNQPNAPGGIVALRDTNGDGKADVRERFGEDGGTSIMLRGDYLWFGRDQAIVRYRLKRGSLVPEGPAEIVAGGLPEQRAHPAKGFAFDGKGGLYVNVGAPSNACQAADRKPGVAGQDPCPLLERHGGVWRFDDNTPNQTQAQAKRFATGMRQNFAMAWNSASGSLFLVQHGRDQLDTLWPGRFTTAQNAELPSEEFLRVDEGSNFGWPYCYHDWQQGKRVLMPEYGGDGKEVDRCAQYPAPIVGFPGHWAPNALIFYTGTQFPQRYRGGAFIAFHGSWNRAPLAQAGYNVAFVPFSGPNFVAGKYEVFAEGFAGRTPLMNRDDALYRPTGLAQGPDGSLYVSDDKTGRIWRIVHRGVRGESGH